MTYPIFHGRQKCQHSVPSVLFAKAKFLHYIVIMSQLKIKNILKFIFSLIFIFYLRIKPDYPKCTGRKNGLH